MILTLGLLVLIRFSVSFVLRIRLLGRLLEKERCIATLEKEGFLIRTTGHFRETRICPAPRSEGVHYLQPTTVQWSTIVKRLVGGRRHYCCVLRVTQAVEYCIPSSGCPRTAVLVCLTFSTRGRPPSSTLMTFLTRLLRL
jgi:hypothetical protein